MAILNSFVNDIFERIASEASSTCPSYLSSNPPVFLTRLPCLLQSSRRTARRAPSLHARSRPLSASSSPVNCPSTPSLRARSRSPSSRHRRVASRLAAELFGPDYSFCICIFLSTRFVLPLFSTGTLCYPILFPSNFACVISVRVIGLVCFEDRRRHLISSR